MPRAPRHDADAVFRETPFIGFRRRLFPRRVPDARRHRAVCEAAPRGGGKPRVERETRERHRAADGDARIRRDARARHGRPGEQQLPRHVPGDVPRDGAAEAAAVGRGGARRARRAAHGDGWVRAGDGTFRLRAADARQ